MIKLFKLTLIALLLFTACKKGSDGPTEIIPLAPSGLNAVQSSLTQINLSWTDNSTNETGFKIERKLANGTYQIIGTTNTNTTNYSDNNSVPPALNYVYRVYSYNSAGNSLNYSNEATITYQGFTVAGGNGQGSAANMLFNPYGVFVDGAGNIYVSDYYNHRIQKWAPGATSGTTVAGGNGLGSAANQFNYPSGVFVDASGNIYVADNRNHRIQKWAK